MRARGRGILIIAGVVAAVLVVAWYFLLFSPTQRKLSDLDDQISSAQSSLSMARAELARLESYKKTAPQSRAEIVRLGKMLPESEGMPGLIVALQETAKLSGVSIDSISRGGFTPGTPFGVQTLTLQLSGRFFDVEDFLYRLEQFVSFRNTKFRATGRLLQVTQLTMTRQQAAGEQTTAVPELTVTLNLNAYTWGGAGSARAATGGAQ